LNGCFSERVVACGLAQRYCGEGVATAAWEALRTRVYVPEAADFLGVENGVDKRLEACRHREFPLARLRRTWASWHGNRRRDHELQRLGGSRCSALIERYAHLAPDHLAKACQSA
jgi:hypothetical protein